MYKKVKRADGLFIYQYWFSDLLFDMFYHKSRNKLLRRKEMKKDNSLDKFVEKYPTYIEALDIIDDLKKQLEEKERQYETLYKLFSEQHEIIDQNELGCFEEVNRLLKEQKDFYIVEKTEYDKMKQGAKDIVKGLKQQLKSQPKEIVEKIRNICCVEDKCEDGSFILGINEKDLDTILKEYQK